MRVSMLVVAALLTALSAEDVAAQRLAPQVGWERYFVVTTEVVERAGRPHVGGYVDNQSGAPAWRVRLLVDGLDASGRIVAQRLHWLPGDVGTFSRRYFEVPAPGPASSYRVSVFAFEMIRP